MSNILLENILFVGLIIIHLTFLVITLSNYFYLKKINETIVNNNLQPSLDIFIPARNEEQNIRNIINSILKCDYNNYRLFILDDHSTDNTKYIVEELVKDNPNIVLLKGDTLPDNWLGKNWTCHQLSKYSESDYILFIDADVTLDYDAISFTMNLIQSKDGDLLSVFPTQEIITVGEHFVVPLMDWLLLTFLPLRKIYTTNKKSLSAANGQFMLFKTKAYKEFGGHEKLKHEIVEDIEFVRGFKSMNKRVLTITGENKIKCRMYNGFNESINGFTKNMYKGFSINSIAYLLITFIVFFLFAFPFVWMFLSSSAIIIVDLILIQRFLASAISKQNPLVNVLIFPFQMVIFIYISMRSLIYTKSNKIIWKNRIITHIK